MANEKSFYILSIDGGGIRGIFPAHILSCIQDKLEIELFNSFDMITGTSTGAILAAGIANKISMNALVDLYKNKGEVIFNRKKSFVPKKMKPGFHSIYNNEALKILLNANFGEVKLGEIEKPLLIPATDIGHGRVHVFKSGYCKDFVRDKNVKLAEAVLASCSAPTYFNPTEVHEYLLADGGLWANNPSLAAVVDAQYRLGIPIKNIKVLSLGTGSTNVAYGTNKNRNWGLLNGWKGKEFITFILSLQSQSAANYLQLILKPEQIKRIDFISDKPLPLDDVSAIGDLISRADLEFSHASAQIKYFLKG